MRQTSSRPSRLPTLAVRDELPIYAASTPVRETPRTNDTSHYTGVNVSAPETLFTDPHNQHLRDMLRLLESSTETGLSRPTVDHCTLLYYLYISYTDLLDP